MKSVKAKRDNYLNIFHNGMWEWRIYYWPHNIIQFFRNIKFAFQRATRGYSDVDLYDLDYFYLKLFEATLKEFPKNLNGAPVEFYDEKNDSVQPWVDHINEIYTHFYNSDEDNEVQKNQYRSHTIAEDMDEERSRKWAERNQEIYEWQMKEFKLAWDMMGKIFHSLWD